MTSKSNLNNTVIRIKKTKSPEKIFNILNKILHKTGFFPSLDVNYHYNYHRRHNGDSIYIIRPRAEFQFKLVSSLPYYDPALYDYESHYNNLEYLRHDCGKVTSRANYITHIDEKYLLIISTGTVILGDRENNSAIYFDSFTTSKIKNCDEVFDILNKYKSIIYLDTKQNIKTKELLVVKTSNLKSLFHNSSFLKKLDLSKINNYNINDGFKNTINLSVQCDKLKYQNKNCYYGSKLKSSIGIIQAGPLLLNGYVSTGFYNNKFDSEISIKFFGKNVFTYNLNRYLNNEYENFESYMYLLKFINYFLENYPTGKNVLNKIRNKILKTLSNIS